MKKYSSVFAMIARCSLYKNLLVAFFMVLVQLFLFLLKFQKYEDIGLWTLAGTVRDSYMIIPLIAGFVITGIFLAGTGNHRGSNQGYLLNRLQISGNAMVGLQALYNFFWFVILWAIEVMVLVTAGLIYSLKAADVTSHTLVLSFYSNNLMHTLLPMKDVVGWFVWVGFLVALAVFLALFSYRQRTGGLKRLMVPMVLLGVVVSAFPRGMGSRIDLLTVSALVFLYGLLIKEFTEIREKGGKENEWIENS